MKQKDIVVIIVVVFFSGVASYFISSKLFVKSSDTQREVKVVETINPAFNTPDKNYFNANSVNPTQTIQIDQKTIISQ